MTVDTDVAGAPTPSSPRARGGHRRTSGPISRLLLCQSLALLGQALAALLSRVSIDPPALVLSFAAMALAYGSAALVLVRPGMGRRERDVVVGCLGVTTFLQWRATDPLLFTLFDEQLHARTLVDIVTSHSLFQPNPLLAVSPRYPGLESVTAVLEQLGLPSVAAGTLVVLIARLVLVFSLCAAAEQVTGSELAGGLAVAVYALSPQFIQFNSQYAYQSLALPMALAAVALIGRSRTARDARPLLAGATVCLLAVAVTHHVTSLLTALFFILWAAVARGGRSVRRIRWGALVAVSSTGAWALVQWTMLREYFGPIANDIIAQSTGSTARRQAFSDPSGYVTPLPERLLLLYYAGGVTLAAAVLVVVRVRHLVRGARPTRHSAPGLLEPTPQKLLLVLAGSLPLVFAVRTLPSGGEFGDRATSFVFLPYSLLVAATLTGITAGWVARSRQRRWAAAGLASLAFLGAYTLGSGPDWQRLPGPYLVSADNRSMDSETLAGVQWAADTLPSGSRIAADRVSADLLSGQARLWPVLKDRQLDAASLYFADNWGPPQTELARQLRLHYLYVDARLADSLPHVGSYFYRGETSGAERLTAAQLVKFEAVPGITIAYRHGPVTVYDLSGLGVPVERSGWTGDRAPPGIVVQLAVGILTGGLLGLGTRSAIGGTVCRSARRYASAAGVSLCLATVVAGACLLSVALLLVHVWLGPASYGSGLLVLLVAGPPSLRRSALRGVRRVTVRPSAAVVAAGVFTAAAVAVAVLSAWSADVGQVRAILNSSSTISQAGP